MYKTSLYTNLIPENMKGNTNCLVGPYPVT